MNRFKTDDEIREFAKKCNTDAYKFIAFDKSNELDYTIIFFCKSNELAIEHCYSIFKREYSYCDSYDMIKLTGD